MCFDHTAEAEDSQELVTIYAESLNISINNLSGPIRYQGEEYMDLLLLLSTMNHYADKGRNTFYNSASKFDLRDLIAFNCRRIYGQTIDSGEPSPREFTIMTALRASLLRIAMGFLRNVYIATFALAMIGFLLIRSSIKKNLTAPCEGSTKGSRPAGRTFSIYFGEILLNGRISMRLSNTIGRPKVPFRCAKAKLSG